MRDKSDVCVDATVLGLLKDAEGQACFIPGPPQPPKETKQSPNTYGVHPVGSDLVLRPYLWDSVGSWAGDLLSEEL